ncbi:MAG: hypothetical protein IT435_02515 [Phycisphaerales bacterium]|nr:hypothetical protein [Phycisphaerales bacterium]
MIGSIALAAAALCIFIPLMRLHRNVLVWITLAWAAAWAVVAQVAPALWPVALLGFIQNVAFTFVSRGRNSGSLGYHLVASIFSNGIYAALLFISIDQVSQAKSMPVPFLIVYTLATMSGSIFAHWMALRLERGKARSVQENSLDKLRLRLSTVEARTQKQPVAETLFESRLKDGRNVRIWADNSVVFGPAGNFDTCLQMAFLKADQDWINYPSADLARLLCESLEANSVSVGLGDRSAVYHREWP